MSGGLLRMRLLRIIHVWVIAITYNKIQGHYISRGFHFFGTLFPRADLVLVGDSLVCLADVI
jgi:hypothetical protein